MAVRVLSLFLLFCLYVNCSSKKCVRFQDHPLAPCAVAGYNYTYPLPDDLSERTIYYTNKWVSFFTNSVKNCSVAKAVETVACMSYAPKCLDANKEPPLPCRRVCSEAMKRCFSKYNVWIMEWILRMCYVLPDATPESGKCYEPKGFAQYYNPNTTGLLEQKKCEKIVHFPFCENLGYNYTILNATSQARVYRFFYGKNVTDPNKSTPRPGSILTRIMASMKKYPACAMDIYKLSCSEFIPPCFPEEGPKFYTVCKPTCTAIAEKCPGLLTGRNQYYYGECERMAPGVSSHGYCKHSKFPPITDWGKYFYKRKVKPKSTPPKGLSTTYIVIIAVVLSLVVTVVIAGSVMLFRRKKQKEGFGYQRQE